MTRIQHNGKTFEIEPAVSVVGESNKNKGVWVNLISNPGPLESSSGVAWFESEAVAISEITA